MDICSLYVELLATGKFGSIHILRLMASLLTLPVLTCFFYLLFSSLAG